MKCKTVYGCLTPQLCGHARECIEGPSERAPSETAGPVRVVAAVSTGSDAFGETADSEIVEHMNKFLDELKWFREHSVKIHLSPTATGWNLKFSVPEK